MIKQVKKSLGKLTKNLKSFSLVELIIVIAIIAILSVAGFMTLTKWIGKARDSRRVSDLQTIQKALTYNYMDSSSEDYPLPDGKQLITGSNGEDLWHQGVFGNEAVKEVSSLSKAPKDPNGDNYEYSVTADQKTWEVYAILEDGEKVSYINQVYAGEGKVIKRGNYKGYIMGATGDMLYNPASMYLTSGTQLTTGSNDDIYQENENIGTSQTVTGMVVTGGTDVSLIADNFGITEDKAETAVNDAANGGSVSVESSSDETSTSGPATIEEGTCENGLCVFNLSDSSETNTDKKLMTYQINSFDLDNDGTVNENDVPSREWGCYQTEISAQSNTDGSGNTQTIAEDQNCADNDGDNGADHVAADYCNQLEITVDGYTYDDWYLPAEYELDAMCSVNKNGNDGCDSGDMSIGGELGSSHMWSSTEGTSDSARYLDSSGNWYYGSKSYTYAVQCVRSADQ